MIGQRENFTKIISGYAILFSYFRYLVVYGHPGNVGMSPGTSYAPERQVSDEPIRTRERDDACMVR
jgi:hypothetical protein